jgi:Tfp pilus assembly protein PilO
MRVTRPILLAAATAGVLLSVGMFTLVVEPRLKERQVRRLEARTLQAKLAKLQADLLVRNRIDKMYEQVAPLIAGTGSDQQEISTFTRELSNLYSALGVRTRSVRLLPTAQEEFYRLLSIKIEMHGDIREIVRFILAVESHTGPLRIEQFGLRARETADEVQASFLVTKVVAEPGP